MNRFLEADYKPTETEVVVQYHVLPHRKDSFHEELHQLVEGLLLEPPFQPKVFDMSQELFQCKIAFSEQLFEPGNIAQNLSVIAGSIFELATVKVLSIRWSKKLMAAFPGPSKGMGGFREQLNLPQRPLSAATLLPKAGLSSKEYLEKAYLIWMGGVDLVVDHDLMSSVEGEFQDRLEYLSQERRSCSERTKTPKLYIPNITAGNFEEMHRRAKLAKDSGLTCVMVNATHLGFGSLTALSQMALGLNLAIYAGQSAHGMLTRNDHLGFSTAALAGLYRCLGADLLSIDHGKAGTREEIVQLTSPSTHPATFPVYTGNIHPSEVASMIKKHGYDLILQTGLSLYQHPDGVKAGAEAFHYALEAATQGIETESAAQKNEPLRRALESVSRS